MRITGDIDLNELLPALERYRRLYWENREHELRGYLLDHDLRERGASDDEVDDAFDAHRGTSRYSELQVAESDVMRVLRGAQPPEVSTLQDEVIEKCGG